MFWKVLGGTTTAVVAVFTAFEIGYQQGKDYSCPTKTDVENVACANSNSIVIVSLKGENDERGFLIRNKLNELGCHAIGPVAPDNEKADLKKSDVRYFHKSDKNDASVISAFLEKEIGIKFVVNGIYALGHKVPKGEMEVWIN